MDICSALFYVIPSNKKQEELTAPLKSPPIAILLVRWTLAVLFNIMEHWSNLNTFHFDLELDKTKLYALVCTVPLLISTVCILFVYIFLM